MFVRWLSLIILYSADNDQSELYVDMFCVQHAAAARCFPRTMVTWSATVTETTTAPRVSSPAAGATSCRAVLPGSVNMDSPGPAQTQYVHVCTVTHSAQHTNILQRAFLNSVNSTQFINVYFEF